MDQTLLLGLAALYVSPTVIVLVRRPTMPLLIITLDLLLGWTIAGWAAALVCSIAFPRRRDLRAQALTAADPIASPLATASGDPQSASFLRDPLTVGVLTFLGSAAYYLWWFWQFFKLARRERFPRARSFWWIFVPIYGLAVIYRNFEDLELRLSPQMRGRFNAKTALVLIIAATFGLDFPPVWPNRQPLASTSSAARFSGPRSTQSKAPQTPICTRRTRAARRSPPASEKLPPWWLGCAFSSCPLPALRWH